MLDSHQEEQENNLKTKIRVIVIIGIIFHVLNKIYYEDDQHSHIEHNKGSHHCDIYCI